MVGDALGAYGSTLPSAVLAGVAGGAVLALLTADAAWRRIGIAVLAVAWGNVAAYRVQAPQFPPAHVAAAPTHVRLRIDAVLSADPERKAEQTRFWLAVQRLDDGLGWRPAEGQVVLTLRNTWRAWSVGDRVRAPLSLYRPRNFGNPGEFDGESYWARRGVYVTAFAEDDAEFERVGHVSGGVGEWLARWRRGVGALFERTLPPPQAAVLSALIIGTDAALPRDLRRAFNRAGVSHVLSISGLHVAMVAAAGYALFRWLLARSRWLLLTINVPKLAACLSAVPVLLYAGIAGSNVATTRSVIMILVFVAAVLVDRQRHLLVSLSLAAIVIVLASPGTAQDISFQLSFVAVMGLVLAMERFWPWWKQWEEERLVRLRGWRARLWRPVAVYVVISLSALAATAPLTAWHFNQVSLAAPFANALVVPLLGSLGVGLGLLAALTYLISEPLAALIVVIVGPFVSFGLWLVDCFAAVPYAAVRVVTPTVLELALIYAGLLVLVKMSGRTRAFALAVIVSLASVDGAYWYAERYHHSDLRLTFLSVGQGDSAVIEFPGAEVMVIDAGGLRNPDFDLGERIIAPFLWSRKIAHVDYLVLSHPQWDHYGGFGFLAANFTPREFWSNGAPADSPRFVQLQRVLAEHGVAPVAVQRAVRRAIAGVEVVARLPPQRQDASINDQSMVLSLGFGGRRVLFPGDIEAATESNLVAVADGTLASAILKVPHHGSRTSSTPGFLDAVAPQLAVVSAGFENQFHFPHEDVVRRYAARHCTLARTDRDGAVRVQVRSDGTIETHTTRRSIGDHGAASRALRQ